MSSSKREPMYNSLSLSIPTITILTAIMIHTLYSYFQRRTKLKKSLTFAALFSISIFWTFAWIILYIAMRQVTHTLTASDCIVYFLKDILMILGKIFMYLFFIGRLFYVFGGSLFSFDRKQIVRYITLTFFLLFTPVLLALPSVISPIHSVIHNHHNIQTQYDCSDIFSAHLSSTTQIMFMVGIAMFTLFDIIISVLILRAFVTRLLWLYGFLSQNNMENSAFLLQTAMKTFNLTAAAITTSWLGIVFNASGYGSHWLCIDMVVNAITMYLSFGFSSNIYDTLSVCCCTNCCWFSWRKLCYCCCLKYELPKHIELGMLSQKQRTKSKLQIPDASIAVSVDKSDKSDNIESTTGKIANEQNTLNNGMKVVLHDYEHNKKPSLSDKLSNLSKNIRNKLQKKRSEKLISDIETDIVDIKSELKLPELHYAQSEPVKNVTSTAVLSLQNHLSN